MKSIVIFLIITPVFLDTCYLLVNKVCPGQLAIIMYDKVKKLEYNSKIQKIEDWHYWCIDKSYRICTVNVELTQDASDQDAIAVK
jgi:hypothetical protein